MLGGEVEGDGAAQGRCSRGEDDGPRAPAGVKEGADESSSAQYNERWVGLVNKVLLENSRCYSESVKARYCNLPSRSSWKAMAAFFER
jgi:hypothetical protein